MSAKLSVSNRQRRMPVNLKQVRTMTATLAAAVFENLRQYPCDHLEPAMVDEISQRGQFSVVLVSNSQIQKLNKQWMGKDRPTDVLSFPLSDEPPPSDELPWEVGEIVISLEKTQAQAEEFGHSFERELSFLFVHGMLHVLGFDHVEPEDEKDMFSRQKQILDASGYKR